VNDVKLLTEGLQFPEGPIAMPDGSVILVEIKRGTLSRVTPDGAIEVVAECGGGPNGAAIGPDGAVYVCNNGGFEWAEPIPGLTLPGHQPEDYIGGRIQRVDLESGKVEDLYTECNGFPLRGPNDLVFDTSGNMWVTDHGKTRPRDKDQGAFTTPRPTARWSGRSSTRRTLPTASVCRLMARSCTTPRPTPAVFGNARWWRQANSPLVTRPTSRRCSSAFPA